MSETEVKMMQQFRTAASMKVCGASWETIARQLDQEVALVRQWPEQFAGLWQQAIQEAEQTQNQEASWEAVHTLRNLLREDNIRMQKDAAAHLIKMRIELRKVEKRSAKSLPSLSPEMLQLAQFVENLSHEQLQFYLLQLRSDPTTAERSMQLRVYSSDPPDRPESIS